MRYLGVGIIIVVIAAAALYPFLKHVGGHKRHHRHHKHGTFVVPVLYDAEVDPLPLVRVSINGQPPLPFVFDTGQARAIVMEPWAAAKMGLQTETSDSGDEYISAGAMFTDAGGTAVFPVGQDQEQIGVERVNYLDDYFGAGKVAGYIGPQALAGAAARLDFAKRTLTIYTRHTPKPDKQATVLNLSQGSGGLDVAQLFGSGNPVDCTVSTGSLKSSVYLGWGASFRTAMVTPAPTLKEGTIVIGPALRLKELPLGNGYLADVDASILPIGNTRATYGLDVLSRYVVTIDMLDHQLILDPVADSGQGHFEPGWTGVHFAPSEPQIQASPIVSYVDPGSPAAQAGLLAGDRFVAVDGHMLAGLPAPAALAAVNGIEGTAARLAVSRGSGKVLNLSITRADEFAAPHSALDGLILEKFSRQPLMVLGVVPGCLGDLAGLRVYDKMVAIDGQPTSAMDVEQLDAILIKQSVRTAVQRGALLGTMNVDLTVPNAGRQVAAGPAHLPIAR